MPHKGALMSETKAVAKSPTNMALAAKVSRDVELDSVLLKSAHMSSQVDNDAEYREFNVNHNYRPSYRLNEAKSRIEVLVAFKIELTETDDSDDSEKEILALEAEFLLQYSYPEGKAYSADNLKYFAELNGTVNVWPYWRELIHTVTARAGLGSITVPVYRAKARRVEATTEGSPQS